MAKTLSELLESDEIEDTIFDDNALAACDIRGKYFRDCRFQHLRLAEISLRDCTFEDCIFESCDLTMATVAGAAFHEARFRRTKLMGVDWTDVRGMIFTATFEECNLSHATFAKRKLCGMVLRDCRIHESTFLQVDLRQAVFTGSDLLGTRFLGTDLREADLSTASNYQINPAENRLQKTRFSHEAALALAEQLGVVVPR
jgi:uncharacterized protein YjbI with pentapeptide repeats